MLCLSGPVSQGRNGSESNALSLQILCAIVCAKDKIVLRRDTLSSLFPNRRMIVRVRGNPWLTGLCRRDRLLRQTGDFVVAGAQAMKFMMVQARATKDIDFVLDVVKLRGEPLQLSAQLQQLGYRVVDGSRNFQFEKRPGSSHRHADLRAAREEPSHARLCLQVEAPSCSPPDHLSTRQYKSEPRLPRGDSVWACREPP